MYTEDTIVAVATPPGPGGVGIIRISGARATGVAARAFRPRQPVAHPMSHHLYVGAVIDAGGAAIDEGLAVFMYGPHSYTGEDVVELHCHGSPVLLRQALARCCEAGARMAEPGEFTKRAFLNNRIDLVQAEAVAEIIQARTEAAARTGLRHLNGTLSGELSALREALIDLKAKAEVLIDFSEEEIDLTPEAMMGDFERVVCRLEDLLRSYRHGRLLREGLHLAIVGRTNVGKSSLLNALLGTERAIVTEFPGTTRDLIEESIDIDGIPVTLSDTAGLREDAEEVERIGIDRARQRAAEADGVLLVLDRSRPLGDQDHSILAAMSRQPAIVVLNKCDLPPAWSAEQVLPLSSHTLVEVSALTRSGLRRLREAVVDIFADAPADPDAPLLTLGRHRDALVKAREAVAAAVCSLRACEPIDLIAVDIQAAVEHIGTVTGAVTTDDVLDRIFREFCIGK